MPETKNEKPQGQYGREVKKETEDKPKNPEGPQWVADGKANEFLLKLFDIPGISAKKKQIIAGIMEKHGMKGIDKVKAEVTKMAFAEGCKKRIAEVFK